METNLPNDDIIRRIHELHGEYDPSSNLSAKEQLEMCEAIAESMYPYLPSASLPQGNGNENGNLKWNANGTYKRNVYFELTESKQKVIEDLTRCNHLTDRHTIAMLLGELFPSIDTKEDHWLYVAQQWNPRAICRTINQMVKTQRNGVKSILNPAAYFTKAIQYRKRRRSVNKF